MTDRDTDTVSDAMRFFSDRLRKENSDDRDRREQRPLADALDMRMQGTDRAETASQPR